MDALTNAKFLAGTQGRWLASQGQYFKAMNGTPGTPITGPTTTAFSTTAALFEVENSAPTGSNVFLYPDYVKLLIAGADTTTAASQFNYVGVIDPILRFSSGGFQPISPEAGPVNVLRMNNQSGLITMPQANWHFGAVVLNTAGANRLIMARGQAKTGQTTNLAVVGDEFYFSFSPGYDVGAGAAKTGTTATIYRQNLGVVCVPPQSSFALLTWFPNLTAAFTFELEAAWFELPSYPA